MAWSLERFDCIKAQVEPYLQSIGFQSANTRFIPVSGLEGGNINNSTGRPPALAAWFAGPTLAQAIGTFMTAPAPSPSSHACDSHIECHCCVALSDVFQPGPRRVDKPFRLCVGDVFHSSALGDAASGKIETGSVQIGDHVQIMPAGDVCKVKGACGLLTSPSTAPPLLWPIIVLLPLTRATFCLPPKAIQRAGVPVRSAFAGEHIEIGMTGIDLASLSYVVCSVQVALPAQRPPLTCPPPCHSSLQLLWCHCLVAVMLFAYQNRP